MGLKASDLLGTSQVGVHLAMVGPVLFAPMQLSKKDLKQRLVHVQNVNLILETFVNGWQEYLMKI